MSFEVSNVPNNRSNSLLGCAQEEIFDPCGKIPVVGTLTGPVRAFAGAVVGFEGLVEGAAVKTAAHIGPRALRERCTKHAPTAFNRARNGFSHVFRGLGEAMGLGPVISHVNAREEMVALRNRFEKQAAEFVELTKKHEKCTQTIAELDSKLRHAEAQKAEIEAAKSLVASQNAEVLEAKNREISTLRDQLASAREAFDNAQSELTRLQEENQRVLAPKRK